MLLGTNQNQGLRVFFISLVLSFLISESTLSFAEESGVKKLPSATPVSADEIWCNVDLTRKFEFFNGQKFELHPDYAMKSMVRARAKGLSKRNRECVEKNISKLKARYPVYFKDIE